MAKWVADSLVHPLYHALLEVKAAPFLAPEPVSKHSLDLLPVRAVMRAPVVSLRTPMRVADIQVGLTTCACVCISEASNQKLLATAKSGWHCHAPTANHPTSMFAQEVLRDTAHNGFPVVRDSPAGQVRL